MSLPPVIRRYACYALFALAVIFSVASLLVHASPLDTDDMAVHVSKRVQRRMDLLDSFADRVANTRQAGDEWVELGGFPDDMVLYRYDDDTLSNWYNLFTIANDDISMRSVFQTIGDPRAGLSSPLAEVGEKASYVNLGPNWYIVKARRLDDGVTVIEGLLVKSDPEENVSRGQNGVNSRIHIHGRYTVSPLAEGEGSPIFIDGEPVFKVVPSQSNSSIDVLYSGIILRLCALMLLAVAMLVYLSLHRNVRNLLIFIASVGVFAVIARDWGSRLSEFYQFFSPALYAQDGWLNSFGTLVFFNAALFLWVFAAYLCRDALSTVFSGTRLRTAIGFSIPVISLALLAFYIWYTLSSLVLNSSISLELYRIDQLSWYSAEAFLSFGLLWVSCLLLIQMAISVVRPGLFILRPVNILLFSTIAAALFGLRASQLGFEKEQSRVRGWSNRLAVDRDLAMELQLRRLENDVATDPMLFALTHMRNAEQLLLRRLDEMYFAGISKGFDIDVHVSWASPLEIGRQIELMIAEGSPIGPQSHFFYNYNASSGSRYTGVFQYHSQQDGLATLILEITPKVGSPVHGFSSPGGPGRVNMPPNYSYARYCGGRLVSFFGNFAYPTVIDGIQDASRAPKTTFVLHGNRHFINRINEDETIIITRSERGIVTYFVTFTYLILFLFLLGMLFYQRPHIEDITGGFFSTKMRRLVVNSLIITLILMASVSVLFVYQRNQRNQNNFMAAKISSLQLMLGGACRQMNDIEEMRNQAFVVALDEISATTSLDINLYSPGGRLFFSNAPDATENPMISGRIPTDAFKALCLRHQRYYIIPRKHMGRPVHMLYAPVFNARGEVLAIASAAYSSRDYDFVRDAIFHAATLISLFIILLFVTIVLFTSLTKAIFRPLLAMGQKMKGATTNNLETVAYSGNDEISSLIDAYNAMVEDLRESTEKLTAAERDKAWSEMARQVAHEIKNPLTPIKLEIQRLQRLKQKNDPSWQDKFDNMSRVVLENIDILSQTASEFGTFAKLYSEDYVDIDLDFALREQLLLYSNGDVEITYLGAADAVISGPKPQLMRVFINLISNAVQAVENVPEPKITVSLRRAFAEGWWDMVFEDNGPGVSDENKDKLFTPNFTTKSSGTGLGLAISRNIVERCGGTITYSRSFSLGGACFTVSIPSNKQDNQI